MPAPLPVDVVRRLVRGCRFGDVAVAAMHVATPNKTVDGIDYTFDAVRRCLSWRSGRTTIPDGDGAVECVYDFVVDHWRDDDEPVEVHEPVLKVVRSGVDLVAFGAELYLPRRLHVTSDCTDPLDRARAFIRSALAQSIDDPAPGGFFAVDGGGGLVEDDGHVCRLHGSTGSVGRGVLAAERSTVEDTAAMLVEALALDAVEVATVGSRAGDALDVDYVGVLDGVAGAGFEIIVPAVLGAGVSVGAPYGTAAVRVHDWYGSERDDRWYGLEAFDPIEPARTEPGWLARHRASGIVAIVRPAR